MTLLPLPLIGADSRALTLLPRALCRLRRDTEQQKSVLILIRTYLDL